MVKEVIEIELKAESAKAGAKEVKDSIKGIDNSAKSASKSTENLGDVALDGAKSFKFMGISINGVSGMLKILKVNLIATGIGAIAVVVGTLAAAFLSTQAGVDKLNSVLKPLQAVLGTIWGVVQNLSTGIVEMLSGDVIKGWNTMGDAVENLGDKMDEAYEKGQRLHELQMRIRNDELNLITATTDLNIKRAKALEIAEDETKTIKDRQDAYKEAIQTENAIAAIRKTTLQTRIDELALSQSINDTSSEEYKELVQLESDLKNAEYDRLTSTTALTKRLNRVKEEAPDTPEKLKQKETFEEWNKRNEEILKKIEQEKAENERVILENAKKNEILKAYLDEKENIIIEAEDRRINMEADAAKLRIKTAQDETDAKIAMQFMLASQIGNALGAISLLFDKGTAASKAAALAEIVIGTGIGFIQGLDIAQKSAKATGPAAAFAFPIFYATQIAAVLGAAGKAKNILTQVKGGGGGGASVGGAQAPQAPQVQAPSFNIVGSSGTNQLATAIGGQSQQPIKAYVVSKDITTAQSLDRNIIRSASIG